MPNEGALQKARKYLRQRKGRRSTRRSSASIDGSVTGESVVSRASSVGANPHYHSCAVSTCNSHKFNVCLEGINIVIEYIPWVSQDGQEPKTLAVLRFAEDKRVGRKSLKG